MRLWNTSSFMDSKRIHLWALFWKEEKVGDVPWCCLICLEVVVLYLTPYNFIFFLLSHPFTHSFILLTLTLIKTSTSPNHSLNPRARARTRARARASVWARASLGPSPSPSSYPSPWLSPWPSPCPSLIPSPCPSMIPALLSMTLIFSVPHIHQISHSYLSLCSYLICSSHPLIFGSLFCACTRRWDTVQSTYLKTGSLSEIS